MVHALESAAVQSGLDVLVGQNFAPLANRRLGIVCNHTARDRSGRHLIDLCQQSGVCQITAIFAPEHGFRGTFADGKNIADAVDSLTGTPIYSLYGENLQPTAEMLKNVDLLVYDIQDVGVRFYTYISTLTNVMRAAAENHLPIVVLDRPNPIRGDRIEGPMLEPQFRSFVGPHPIPIRYGLTAGELARLINGEHWLGDTLRAELTVIKMQNWRRAMWFDETGLPWFPPSPNMPTLLTATVYPGFCFMEGTNLSEGRGTDSPFVQFGAPYIDGKKYAHALNALQIEGVQFQAVKFTPQNIPQVASRPKYEGLACQGVKLIVTDRERFLPIKAAVLCLAKARELYPTDFKWRENHLNRLYGKADLLRMTDPNVLIEDWRADVAAFTKLAQKYYLYP